MENAKYRIWERGTHTQIEKMDSEKFYKDFILKVIVNWKGLTAGILAKMLPVKIDDPDIEIAFSPENALEIMKEAYDFDAFIQGIVMDIESFRTEKKEGELKNSESLQTG